jgi:hypothetical protein
LGLRVQASSSCLLISFLSSRLAPFFMRPIDTYFHYLSTLWTLTSNQN